VSEPRINGARLLAAYPVVNPETVEIERWYVVLDAGREYVTVALDSLDHKGEWSGSGRYTTSLVSAIEAADRLARAHARANNREEV
jgi:hypothetical protein